LYFLLHGRPPFVGESRIDTVMLHRHAQAPSLREGRPDAPESLDDVFQRMVAKSPGDRYQSMTEVVAALEARHIDPQITPPSKPVAASPSETARAPTEDYWGDDSTAADASVLLVEPSGAQALVIRQFLESLGVGRIERCRTGAELLQALPQCSAHVVISAMHLDDMTGLELAQHLVANAPHKRIGFILISTSLDPANLNDQARGMGVTLLAKPFDDRQLADALSAAVATT
jgi:CheY-like chemotaxis protein